MARMLHSVSMSLDGFIAGGHNVKLERLDQREAPLATNLWFRVVH